MSITQRVKRSLVLGAAGAMVLSLLPAGIAAADPVETDGAAACEGSEGLVDFNDALGFFSTEIECMAAYGITQGDDEGNFNSTGNVTRQQMAQFIARLATQATNGDLEIAASDEDAFDDIAGINADARDAINFLASFDPPIVAGVGDGSNYNPGGNVTRQQMASFIARAHEALGVDFSGNDDPIVFPDADDIAEVHAPNIDLLTGAGIVAGRNDGTFGPGADITRGQMSSFIVRSIVVLDAQGLWNGEFTATGPELVFTVLEDDTNVDLNETGVRGGTATTGIGDGENLIPLSDGDAVSVFQFSVPEDDFSIDGDPASPAAFLAALEVGATLVATPTADGFSHDLTPAPQFLLEGVVGNIVPGNPSFDFVEAASGETLFNVPAAVASGQEYTVDGAAATEAEFLEELSVGDYLEAEVLAGTPNAGATNLGDLVYRHNLTNRELTGEVVADGGTSFTVDVNPDDDGVFGTSTDGEFDITGFVVSEVLGADTYDVTVASSTTTTPTVTTFAELTDELAVGDDVAYARSEGEVVATVTVDTSPTVYEGVVETIEDTTGDATITLADGSTFPASLADVTDTAGVFDIQPATTFTSFRVDGAVVTEADLIDLVSLGDSVTATRAFGAADTGLRLSFTTDDLAGDVDGDTGIDTTGNTLDVDVSSTVSVTVSYVTVNADWNLEGSSLRYFVDGTLVTLADFEEALDDADTADAVIGFELVDTGAQLQYRITTS